MKRALKAYGWWVAGVLSAVALAWAYHRRLVGALEPEPEQPAAAEVDAQ